MTKCLNCGNTFKGNYCPNCGQKAATKRMCQGEMLRNLVAPFVGGDNKFVRTCLDLLLRPGCMVRDYLLGKRIRYYHPLQLFVFVLTAYAIISYILGISSSIIDEMATMEIFPDTESSDGAFLTTIMNGMNKLYANKLYGTLFAAIFAVPPYTMVFKKCKLARPDGQRLSLNLSEQFYAQMYHSCIVMIISIFLLPLCLIPGTDTLVKVVYQVMSCIYIVFLYKQMLGISWLKSILLNVLSAVLAMLFMCFILVIFFVIAGVMDASLQ